MAYADVADVAVRLGVSESDLNTEQVQAILDDVSMLVNSYTGLDFAADVPADIEWVTVNRTIRMLNNPDGIRQESLGTYSYSLATDAETFTSGWTAEERAILASYGTVSAGRVLGSLSIGYVEGSA
jgi:hypothetical protein